MTRERIQLWDDDLDVLVRELPALHPNLFHTLPRDRFDAAVADLRRRLPTLARHEVVVALMRLAAAVGGGHTGVTPWRDLVGFHTLPVALHRFADGYHVHAATNDRAALLGARVTHVGGLAVDAAQERVAPLIGRDNDMGVLRHAAFLLAMPEVLHAVRLTDDPQRAQMTVEADGRSTTVTLEGAGPFPDLSGAGDAAWVRGDGWRDLRDAAPAPLWLARPTQPYWFTPVPHGELLYCQLNEIRERGETFDAFFARALAAAEVVGARRFVLHLRHNGGGDGTHNVAIVRALLRSRFDAPGRLFVVIGRRTFSAAQMLIGELERWTHPLFVGEPSGSRPNHFGDSALVVLPHLDVTVRVATLWWQLWDPRDGRSCTAVDVAAPLTVDDYRTGRDPALAAIIGGPPLSATAGADVS